MTRKQHSRSKKTGLLLVLFGVLLLTWFLLTWFLQGNLRPETDPSAPSARSRTERLNSDTRSHLTLQSTTWNVLKQKFGPNLKSLMLVEPELSDGEWTSFLELYDLNLESLDIIGDLPLLNSDEFLAKILGMSKLKRLRLERVDLGPECIDANREENRASGLESLELVECQISDEAAYNLARMVPKVQELVLSRLEISENGITCFSDLKDLATLRIYAMRDSNSLLSVISEFRNLRTLAYGPSLGLNSKLPVEFIAKVKQLPKLEVLGLDGNWQISNELVAMIGELKDLKVLSLTDSNLSQESLLVLRANLAETVVLYDYTTEDELRYFRQNAQKRREVAD